MLLHRFDLVVSWDELHKRWNEPKLNRSCLWDLHLLDTPPKAPQVALDTLSPTVFCQLKRTHLQLGNGYRDLMRSLPVQQMNLSLSLRAAPRNRRQSRRRCSGSVLEFFRGESTLGRQFPTVEQLAKRL